MALISSYGTFTHSKHQHNQAASSRRLPILYRCSLLIDNGDGGIYGIRLGSLHANPSIIIIEEVKSESIQGVCQVNAGDIITHVNGERVKSLPHAQRLLCHTNQSMAELRLIRGHCNSQSVASLQHQKNSQQANNNNNNNNEEEESGLFLDSQSCPSVYYEVHPKDHLSDVAQSFHTSIEQIRQDNREYFSAGEKGSLVPGLLLKVRNPEWKASSSSSTASSSSSLSLDSPLLPTTPLRGESLRGASDATSNSSTSCTNISPRRSCLQRKYHEVLQGETLDEIAKLYRVDVLDLRKWNRSHFPVGEAREVRPGDKLLIYEASGSGNMDEDDRGKIETGQRRRRKGGGAPQ